jgi:Rrf2 family nitric oxide-sensitive transcriptional repressor
MHLTLHTDYAFRILLYLTHYPERPIGTAEISTAFGISKHHLVRVVQTLAQHQFVTATAGRSGGVRLAKPAAEIRVGDVVRACEPNFRLVECFDKESNTCPIVPVCGLKAPLRSAMDAFLQSLDEYTLADVANPRQHTRFINLLQSQ